MRRYERFEWFHCFYSSVKNWKGLMRKTMQLARWEGRLFVRGRLNLHSLYCCKRSLFKGTYKYTFGYSPYKKQRYALLFISFFNSYWYMGIFCCIEEGGDFGGFGGFGALFSFERKLFKRVLVFCITNIFIFTISTIPKLHWWQLHDKNL